MNIIDLPDDVWKHICENYIIKSLNFWYGESTFLTSIKPWVRFDPRVLTEYCLLLTCKKFKHHVLKYGSKNCNNMFSVTQYYKWCLAEFEKKLV